MIRTPIYGTGNPHPLSTMKTELVYEVKYNDYGNRHEWTLPGAPCPSRRLRPSTSSGVRPRPGGSLTCLRRRRLTMLN